MKKTKNASENSEIIEEAGAEEIVLPKAQKPVEETAALEKNITRVGNLLKEMRVQKGLKLAEISKKLCIRAFYLEAIEESRYQDIPEFPYGAGFIRSYADFLGLNSSNIIELYKEETNVNPDKNIYVLEPQAEATVPGKKYVLISILALAAVYLVWYSYNAGHDISLAPEEIAADTAADLGGVSSEQPIAVDDYSVTVDTAPIVVGEVLPAPIEADQQIVMTNESFVEPEAVPASAPSSSSSSSVEAVAAPKAEVKTEAPKEAKPEAKPVKNAVIPGEGVVIDVTKEVWIEAKDADKLYLSKVLQPGDRYTVPEVKGMILSAGKVDGVNVYINGKLTPVFTNTKKMNVSLDKFLNPENR